jgi:glutamate synthase (ferredoxin)
MRLIVEMGSSQKPIQVVISSPQNQEFTLCGILGTIAGILPINHQNMTDTQRKMEKQPLWKRPEAQGLYDPRQEHDACGVGFVAHIKGQKSHQIVQDALTILKNLRHRGACGCEYNTGDGAGILFQLPHKYFQENCPGFGINLPNEGEYGVGMVFMPVQEKQYKSFVKIFEKIVKEEGQEVLGWRKVQTTNRSMGESAKASEPYVSQIFIGKSANLKDQMAFERKLYVIRCRVENEIRYSKDVKGASSFMYPAFQAAPLFTKACCCPSRLKISSLS